MKIVMIIFVPINVLYAIHMCVTQSILQHISIIHTYICMYVYIYI